MDRRVTPPKRVTSPAWGPPPPCKQALRCWPYLLYRSVDYGKRAWRLFGTVFKQIRAQKRAAPSCFGFTGAKAGQVVAVLTTSFGKILIYQLFAAVKLKQREKNVVLVASPLRMLSMIQLKQCFFKTILYQKINYSLNCNYQLSTLCRVICFLLHLPLVFL